MGKRVLVTGGAGYIGSHTCLRLAEAGFEPIVFDNLTNGHRSFVNWGPLEVGDVRDKSRVFEVVRRYEPVAVIHFAALIEVGESTRAPGRFFEVNVGGAINVIDACLVHGVDKFVFSSTCATFGNPENVPMDEAHPQKPINPYGRSKLIVEQMLSDYDAHNTLRSVCLRYFNAAGCDPLGRIGERHDPETHIIPLAIATSLGRRAEFKIFGDDYPTADGTAVRDYVHVLDLADAHVSALKYLLGGGLSDAFNLGTGNGYSVLELLDAIEARAGAKIPVVRSSRRSGDAPALVANSKKAGEVLDWRPRYSLSDIVGTAYDWHSQWEPRMFGKIDDPLRS